MGTPQGIDISTTSAVADREDRGQTVHIRDGNGDLAYYPAGVPDGSGTEPANLPVTILIAGTYSSLYRKSLDARQERMLKSRRITLTPGQIRKNQIDLVAGCIISWAGFFNAGAPLPCTVENARTLLAAAPWIRDQLEEAMDDHAAFFAAPSTS